MTITESVVASGFVEKFNALTAFTVGFANSPDDTKSATMFCLLRTAAHMQQPEARALLVDAVATEMGLKKLPSALIEGMRAADEPFVCGPAARDRLKYVYFELANSEKPGESFVSGLAYTYASPKAKALHFCLPAAELEPDNFVPLVRKSFDGFTPRT